MFMVSERPNTRLISQNRAPEYPLGSPSGGHMKIYSPMGRIGRAFLKARAFGQPEVFKNYIRPGWAAHF